MIIASAQVSTTASPAAVFDRWADMATWPQWNSDTEWVRLDGPFIEGATGRLKPKGGPKVRFVVERLVPEKEFVDVSHLIGARLVFDHRLAGREDGGSDVRVEIRLTGHLARVWLLVLGRDLRRGIGRDLDGLARAAERSTITP